MPELPEVETVVRGLRKTVQNSTIKSVILNNTPASTIVVGKSLEKKGFAKALKGKKIEAISRRGKNILISLSGNLTLWAHLKMTGHFFYLDSSEPIGKHDLVIFNLINSDHKNKGTKCLRFNDYRRFGRLRLFNNDELWEQKGLKELGPEPLEISEDDFIKLFKNRSRMIKSALLDQSFIVGIGNIYADEALHQCKIHPKKITSSLSKKKLIELHNSIQKMLKYSISKMGTTVDSFSGINGKQGSFQKYLKAYNNEGNPCQYCGQKIIREKIGSRSAHFCPRCQRH